ncbi:MAG TPA: hypothetical protein VEL07_04065 [Planctomycetota bacterium]|nr:hypothetical protein [Planctomycetota bacterium]
MASTKLTQATTDHDDIRRWAEERGGTPSIVRASRDGKRGGGILRIDFPGYSGADELEEISWEEFFRIFDENELAFLRQDRTRDNEISRFNKFIRRDSVDDADE